MAGEVRYTTTSDDVRIAYAAMGEGPPLVLFPNIFASFSLMHELPWYEDFVQRVSEGRTLIRYDQRGTGLSQREVEDVRAVSTSKDVEAVLDALGLERASLLAGGPLGSVAIWFAASRPERVAALVVFGTSARLRDTNTGEVVAALAHLARNNWDTPCSHAGQHEPATAAGGSDEAGEHLHALRHRRLRREVYGGQP